MCRVAANGTSHLRPARDTTRHDTLVRSSIRIELSALLTSGVRSSILTLTSPTGDTQRALFFFASTISDMAPEARALSPGSKRSARDPNIKHRSSRPGSDGYYVTISALSSLELRGHEAPA